MLSNRITMQEYEVACSIAGLINLKTAAGKKRESHYSSDGPQGKVAKMVQEHAMPQFSPEDGPTLSEVASEKVLRPNSKYIADDEAALAKVTLVKSLASGATSSLGLGQENDNKLQSISSQKAEPDLKHAPFFYHVDHSQEMGTNPPAVLTESGRILSVPAEKHVPGRSEDLRSELSTCGHAEQLDSPGDGPSASKKVSEPYSKDAIDDEGALAKVEVTSVKSLASSVGATSTSGDDEHGDSQKSQSISSQGAELDLKHAPFFYYIDHSEEKDTNPPTLLAESGRIPSFPVKMHAILSKSNLKHIVAWDDHGRSFKILDQQQFEQHILPRYFQQSKIASFYRLINGWNFRRIQSNDNPNCNSYYEEHFLRNMPWLCKKMKRHKIGKKMYIPMGELGQLP